MSNAQILSLNAVLNHITEAFQPKPIRCNLNGKVYLIEKTMDGWVWRIQDGDLQQDFDLAPFPTAQQCQQSAIYHVSQEASHA